MNQSYRLYTIENIDLFFNHHITLEEPCLDHHLVLERSLVKENVITPIQVKNALDAQRGSGARLGHELARLGYIEESELTSFLSKQYGVPSKSRKY